jgi:hypothetical protein
MRIHIKRIALGAAAALGLTAIAGIAGAATDFGQFIEGEHQAHSMQNFGIAQALTASSQDQITAATANADPTKLVTLAKQLKAKVVAVVPDAPNVDMMVLWPNDTNPTWIIACNEQDPPDVDSCDPHLGRFHREYHESGLDLCKQSK